MAFFGGPQEERDQRKQEKAEAKDQKKQAKIDAYLHKNGIEDLEPEFRDQVQRILSASAGQSWFEASASITFAGTALEKIMQGHAEMQVNQNWLMINQLDKILKELRTLNTQDN